MAKLTDVVLVTSDLGTTVSKVGQQKPLEVSGAPTLDLSQGTAFTYSVPSTETAISFSNPPSGGFEFSLLLEGGEGPFGAGFDISAATPNVGPSSSVNASSQLSSGARGSFFRADGLKLFLVGNGSVFSYTLTTAYDLNTATYDSLSYSTSSQDSTPAAVAFSPAGTTMFVAGAGTTRIYQYTLSTAWNVSTASYAGVSFSTSSQRFDLLTMYVRPDGLRIYTGTGSNIFQYNLSTAWNLSTMSYSGLAADTFTLSGFSVSGGQQVVEFTPDGAVAYFSPSSNQVYKLNLSTAWTINTASWGGLVSTIGSTPKDYVFSPTGGSLFVLESSPAALFTYTLSSAFDVSSATKVNPTSGYLSASPLTTMAGVTFSTDGTKVYLGGVVGGVTPQIRQYALATPWALSSVTGSPATYTPSNGGPSDIAFSTDGTKLFVLVRSADRVDSYTLSTSWDVTTATYDSVTFSVSTAENDPWGLSFSQDGLRMYVIGNQFEAVVQCNLSTAWNIATAVIQNPTAALTSSGTNPRAAAFRPDGLRMYIMDAQADRVMQYPLSTAWALPSASLSVLNPVSPSVSGQDGQMGGMFFKDDGTKLYLIGVNNRVVYQYTLSTAWDITTATYDTVSFSVAAEVGGPSFLSVSFKNDGAKMFVCTPTNGGSVYEYDLSTPWDLSTAAYNSANFSTGVTALSAAFKSDGTKMYVSTLSPNTIRQYTLSTPWSVSTATYDDVLLTIATNRGASPRYIVFSPDGLRVYVISNSVNAIYMYSLATAWDLSTAVYPGPFSVLAQDSVPLDMAFSSDGTKMFVVGSTNDRVYQYTLSAAYDVWTAAYGGVNLSVSQYATVPSFISFGNSGKKLFVLDEASDALYEYSTAALAPTPVSYPNSVLWPEGAVPNPPSNGEIDVLRFLSVDGGETYYGRLLGSNFS
jgi:6-phosphogluconolactonase (cycloisomerase 2 family)